MESWFGADDLPLPWEMNSRPAPPDYQIPCVTPPRWLRDILATPEQVVNSPQPRSQDSQGSSVPGSETGSRLEEQPTNLFRPRGGAPSPELGLDMSSIRESLSTTTVAAQENDQAEMKEERVNQALDEANMTIEESDLDQDDAMAFTEDKHGHDTEQGQSPRGRTKTISPDPDSTVLEASTTVQQNISTVPRKRKARQEWSDEVETRAYGKRRLTNKGPAKKIDKLLERGKYSTRVWFYCKYVGEDDTNGDVIFQTELKKQKYAANMVKAWEKTKA